MAVTRFFQLFNVFLTSLLPVKSLQMIGLVRVWSLLGHFWLLACIFLNMQPSLPRVGCEGKRELRKNVHKE